MCVFFLFKKRKQSLDSEQDRQTKIKLEINKKEMGKEGFTASQHVVNVSFFCKMGRRVGIL